MTEETGLLELESEIRPADPQTADRLRALHAVLVGEAEPGGWLTVSPFDVVDVDVVVARVTGAGHADGRIAKAEVARNVLILVPIVLTWLGLFYAAFGYQAAIKADPTLVEQPFLVLWAQDFMGLVPPPVSYLSFLSLWVVAGIDVCIIVAVIVLTWWIQAEVSVAQADKERVGRALEARLRNTLGGAALELAGRGTLPSLVDTFRTTSSALAAELRAERTRLGRIGAESERLAADMRAIVRDLRTGSEGFLEATRALTPVLDRIDAASATIATSVTTVAAAEARLGSAIAAQTEELRHEHGLLTDNASELRALAETTVRTIEGTLPEMSAELARAEERLHGEVERLRAAIEADRADRRQADGALVTQLAPLPRLLTSFEAMSTAQAAAAQRFDDVVTQLRGVAGAITRVIDAEQSRAGDVASSMRSIATAVDKISREGRDGR